MRGVLALVFLLSCAHSLVALPTPTEILTTASINLFNGIIKGILEENESIFADAQMLPSCVINGVETLEIFDYVVSELTIIANLSASQFETQMETLTTSLQKSLIPSMGACNFNASNITAVQIGLTALSQTPSIGFELPPTLTIGGIEVFDLFSSFLAEWEFSNYHQAGYYLGAASRKVSTNTTDAPTCTHVDDSDARLQRALHKVRASLQAFVAYDDEEIIIPPMWNQAWDWCARDLNQTASVDFCKNGILGESQYYYLNSMNYWQDGGFSNPNVFDESYYWFLNDMNVKVVIDYINSNYSNTYYRDLEIGIENAMAQFSDNSTLCPYLELGNPNYYYAPCWFTSILPGEWMTNYQNGMYQGGVFTEISEYESSEHLCVGSVGDADAMLIKQMKEYGFIEAQVGGEWHPLEYNLFDNEVNVTYNAKSVSRVDVSPGDWFNNSIIAMLENYPNAYSYLNYVNGTLNAIVTGMVIASELQVNFSTSVTFGYAVEDLTGFPQNATAYRAGPFFSVGDSWDAETGHTDFSATSSGGYAPTILAFIIRKLPLTPSN